MRCVAALGKPCQPPRIMSPSPRARSVRNPHESHAVLLPHGGVRRGARLAGGLTIGGEVDGVGLGEIRRPADRSPRTVLDEQGFVLPAFRAAGARPR